jgi:beta-lactamase class A
MTNRLTRRVAALCLALSAAAPAVAQQATPPEPGLRRLEAQFEQLARVTTGTVGVAAVHLESGRAAYLNRHVPFPMASTVKVPLAVQLLTRVDRGELRLDSMIALRPTDLHPGSGTLTDLFRQPGVVLSARNLMELMLRISDNSATDILLRTAGGGRAVNERLAALGVSGMRADRSTLRLIADYAGVQGVTSDEVTMAEFGRLARAVTDSGRRAALAVFLGDPRDTSSPDAMARLLEQVWKRQALSPASSELLLDIMYRCVTGAERIKGLLPPETRVAHKTGSLAPGRGIPAGGHTVNDVGIIDLPGNAGHLLVAAFVKDADDAARAERAIAHVARAAYDYFTVVAPPPSATPAAGAGARR